MLQSFIANKVAIGIDDYETIRKKNCFYIDKTEFIKEWWESEDKVTLITRPRRFGKTLNISMLECFFSNKYSDRADLFEGMSVWEDKKYHEIQGTYPVISLSFASVKETTYEAARIKIFRLFTKLYMINDFLLEGDILKAKEKDYFNSVSEKMDEVTACDALHNLSDYLLRYYGKKLIIFLDEYDAPMQEAYVYGYWDDMSKFMRGFFNSSFKTNPYMERVLMTGITRLSKESIFSDFNNVKVVTSTSDIYETAFGFTQKETFDALDIQRMGEYKDKAREWYDGFTFGNVSDIYNPWSVINLLRNGSFDAYWVNTSSNSLVNKLIREGSNEIKIKIEDLLTGGYLEEEIDEQIVFNQLDNEEDAVWSLLLASGYLKIKKRRQQENGEYLYELTLTNKEVYIMFRRLIKQWFKKSGTSYNGFIKALLKDNVEEMNDYMNDVALNCFSFFDNGKNFSEKSIAERFYHGFVLGLMVELRGRFVITSNRESGYGRYDIMLTPLNNEDNAVIIEFKVRNAKKEKSIEETLAAALRQIKEKAYDAVLIEKGIAKSRIKNYGFAFEGKNVLI